MIGFLTTSRRLPFLLAASILLLAAGAGALVSFGQDGGRSDGVTGFLIGGAVRFFLLAAALSLLTMGLAALLALG